MQITRVATPHQVCVFMYHQLMLMNDVCDYVNTLNISGTANTSVTVITTQNSQSSTEDSILLIAIMGSGVVVGLLVILMIILVLFLYHFKRKAGKLTEEKQGVYISVRLLHVEYILALGTAIIHSLIIH